MLAHAEANSIDRHGALRFRDSMPFVAALAHLLYADDVDEAFHGTMSDACAKILAEGFIVPVVPNTGQLLGPGVYFWEGADAQETAFEWIFSRATEGEVCVLMSKLDLDLVLDLRDNDGIKAYNLLAERLMAEIGLDEVSHAQVLAFAADSGLIDSSKTETLNEKSIVCVYKTECIKETCLVERM